MPSNYSVTFAVLDERIASSRLRARIPQEELLKMGVSKGADILVYGKHVIPMQIVKRFGLSVFDCCDDHFNDQFADYYRRHTANADLVTVNSDAMARIVLEKTGCDAVVIPDPYESDEHEPGAGKGLFWFGHESNLIDLHPYLDLNPEILTGEDWSRDKQDAMLADCAAVIIPTGKSMAKSANRLIDAVRHGRFVIAGELPAHDEFRPFMWIGDIREGVEWFYVNRSEAIERVRECQHFIRTKYSPESIGGLWFNALGDLWQSATLPN